MLEVGPPREAVPSEIAYSLYHLLTDSIKRFCLCLLAIPMVSVERPIGISPATIDSVYDKGYVAVSSDAGYDTPPPKRYGGQGTVYETVCCRMHTPVS